MVDSAELPPELVDHIQRDPAARAAVEQKYRDDLKRERMLAKEPVLGINPHSNGQLQALYSQHIYRILVPGNGWGKTTLMAVDAELLLQGTDGFKPGVLPRHRPATAIWFCQKYQEFEIKAHEIEQVFTPGWRWNGRHNMYKWPNGARLFILSADSDWTAVQGVQIDAVYFDEHPDRKFWNEMQFRRRGDYKTRYMVAATMTQGMTWFVQSVIQPWEKWMKERGYSHQQALQEQPHPTTFVWDTGGIEDNPIMTEEDRQFYASIETVTEREMAVRMQGGYADFSGEAVFNIEALESMPAEDGEHGRLVFIPDESETKQQEWFLMAQERGLQHRFAGEMDPTLWRWDPDAEVEGGRITVFEHPDPDEAHNYVIGADFAAGLPGKDYDAAVVGRIMEDGRVKQVAEAVGHWGDVFFAEILFSLGVYYHEAFIVGERQFGLPALRRLFDEMGYSFLYHGKTESSRARRMSDMLGHHRGVGDPIIPNHRKAIKGREILLLSQDTIDQHKRYQFQPRRKDDTIDDVERSDELVTGAPSGEHDDLVMASAYCVHAARYRSWFPKPERPYRRGTFGDVMGVRETLQNRRRANRDPYDQV